MDDIVTQIMDAFDLSPEGREWVMRPDPERERRRAREQRYIKSLPRRMQAAADEANRRYADVLPEGMRFEWG